MSAQIYNGQYADTMGFLLPVVSSRNRLQSCSSAGPFAGWHPYWDGTVFNHDSELIKDGGFEEPEYTGFIPPEHFRYQCPRCLVRVEHSFGVCGNCSYGSCPGDEKEYYERWGS